MSEFLVAARCLSDGSLALLAGLLVISRVAGRPTPATGARVLLLLLALTGLAAQIASIAYSAAPDDSFLAWHPISLIVTGTWSGEVLFARLCLTAALLPAVLWRGRGGALICDVGVAANLFLLPFSGHGVSVDPWWIWGTLHGIHTLAALAWAGAVPVLALHIHRTGDPADRQRAVARFSPVALAFTLVAIGSGIAAAFAQIATVPALIGTPYGQLLLIKAGLLLGMALAWAAWLRRVYLRAVSKRSPLLALSIEATSCLAMIGVAAAMAQSIPGRHADIAWPLPFRLDFHLLAPGRSNASTFWLYAGLAGASVIACLVALAIRRRKTSMIAGLAALGFAGVGLSAIAVPAYPTTYAVSPSAYAVDRLANAETLFAQHCVDCHGRTGHGDGPVMTGFDLLAADLTAPHTGDHTAGDMYWWITHGLADSVMEGIEAKTTEQDRWDLVNYVRLLTNSARSSEVGYDVLPLRPFLPSIDLAFSDKDGATQSLRDLEGQPVLLVLGREPWSLERLAEFEAHQAQLREAKLFVVFVCGPEIRDRIPESDTPPGIAIVRDEADPIIKIWTYYRRTPGLPDPDDAMTDVGHQEYLIDRYGYVRAKWRSDDGIMPSMESILDKVKAIAAEPRLLPSPEQHLH